MSQGKGNPPLWQRRIQANLDLLVEKLTCLRALTDHLVSALVFSPHDVSFVHKGDGPNAARTKTECNRRFVARLLDKGSHAYQAFIEALTAVGSLSLVERLESTFTGLPALDATGKTSERSGNDVPLYSSGPSKEASKEASATAFPAQAVSVHNLYIKDLGQLVVGNTAHIGHQYADHQGAARGTEEMCPKSLMIALLNEILFRCQRKEEAVYTLEQKLCSGLREVGRHIVSFQEEVGIPFRQFLENNSDHFEVTERGNEFIVSRVKDRRDRAPVAEASRQDVEQTLTRIRKPSHQGGRPQQQQEARQKATTQPVGLMPGTWAEKTKCPQMQGTADRCEHDTRSSSIHDDVKDDTGPSTFPKKQKQKLSLPALTEQHVHTNTETSFISTCLAKKSGDNIIFRTSSDVYKADPTQFCIDLVSLWNTPDREEAFIVLGVKSLVSLPHQVIGLRFGSNNAYYKKIFNANLFDSKPKFSYHEMMHEGKLVGVIKVEKSEGLISPSIVISDKHSPRLRKNQLWIRKGGKNLALEGSDMTNDLVRKVYSWFLRHQKQRDQIGAHGSAMNCSLTKNTADQTHDAPTDLFSASSVDSLSTDTGETFPLMTEILTPQTTDSFTRTESDGHSHDSDVYSFPQAISEEKMAHAESSKNASSDSPILKHHETSKSSDLMKALTEFKKGHFVLLCGTLSNVVPNLHVLSYAPWITVYDFDVSSRESGMLSCLEDGLKKMRSISVCTWMDTNIGITERGTQWWSLRGRLDVPDSNLSDLSPLKWLQKVCNKVDKLCMELARFGQDYTVLNILVVWPESKDEIKCMQKFLNKLLERIHITPSLLIWFTDTKSEHASSLEVKCIQEDWEDNVHFFHHSLEAFCIEAESVLGDPPDQTFFYQLPSEDRTSVDISLEHASYLKQDFEVLYLKNPYRQETFTSDALQRERDNFFRGGSISWIARYDMGATCFDVERSLSKEIINHIDKFYIQEFRGGVIHLFHAPGSGGSTMSQRILFYFHEITPCVHMKDRSGSSTEEVGERLAFLYGLTRMPVLVLLDGGDDQILQQLRLQLRNCVIIFLSVKRYPHLIDTSRHSAQRLSKFFLPGKVNEQESRHLVLQFGNCCQGVQGKLRALQALDEDVQKKRLMHQMFEYGLSVYDHEFRGVRAYVKGYLQIDQTEATELKQWQKCLGYLSLVYYYAHASLPCHFVGKLLGPSTNAVLSLDDFPYEVRMLVVADTNEGKNQYVRIMHYAIATEILEQILNNSNHRSEDGRLSTKAKENLRAFCINFLDQTAQLTTKTSLTVMNILTRTFIIRDMAEMIDYDTDSEAKKKPPPFSQILLDMDSHSPYHDRLLVLQKLSDVYPENPNFKAHLGRFYSLCQPEQEKEAETNFKEAIQLAHESNCCESTNTRDRSCVDLMFIHHMYACFFQRRIQRRKQGCSSLRGDAGVDYDYQAILSEMIADADQACQNFSLSRRFCPAGSQDAHCYFIEIDVRLSTCSFIMHSIPGNVQALLQSLRHMDTAYTFFKKSIVETEDLITECYNSVLLDDESLAGLQRLVQKFNLLFRGMVEELQAVADDDPLTSLRLKITSKKLQYDRPDNVVFVENPKMPSDVIAFVVETYQAIFNHRVLRRDMVPAKLELDYHNWILAIRNPNFNQDYDLEQVLYEVRRWCDTVNSLQSVSHFYLFTVLSLLGLGTSNMPGNEECLEEAQKVKTKAMRVLSRVDPRARQQREWLGKEDSSGIRRLLSNSYVPRENHRLTGTAMGRLAVCKGTVLGKPRPAAGFINMDVCCKTAKPPSVKVFFVPAHAQQDTYMLKGSRVQFHLGFSQEHGYQAFEVQALNRFRCMTCGMWSEITKDLTSVVCKGKLDNGKQCGAQVFKH